MKRYIYSLMVALSLLGATAAQAQYSTFTTNISQYGNIILTGAVQVVQLEIQGNTLTNATVAFYNTSLPTNHYIWTAYTNTVQFLTNYVTVITNFTGLIQTNTNYGVAIAINRVAAGSNNLPAIATYPMSVSSIRTEYVNWICPSGLLAMLNTNLGVGQATVTVYYKRLYGN